MAQSGHRRGLGLIRYTMLARDHRLKWGIPPLPGLSGCRARLQTIESIAPLATLRMLVICPLNSNILSWNSMKTSTFTEGQIAFVLSTSFGQNR